jgi:hypothetical protein
MEAQPDFQRLSEVFATVSVAYSTASQEVARIPNVPTFNDGQRLFEAINNLNTSMTERFVALEDKIATLDRTMNTRFDAVGRRFDALELSQTVEYVLWDLDFIIVTLLLSRYNNAARLENSTITNRDIPLRALHD